MARVRRRNGPGLSLESTLVVHFDMGTVTIVGLENTLEGRCTGQPGCKDGRCGTNVVVGDALVLSIGHITMNGVPNQPAVCVEKKRNGGGMCRVAFVPSKSYGGIEMAMKLFVKRKGVVIELLKNSSDIKRRQMSHRNCGMGILKLM